MGMLCCMVSEPSNAKYRNDPKCSADLHCDLDFLDVHVLLYGKTASFNF